MKIFLAALLGALAIFLWSFVAHMFTPLGEAGVTPLPAADMISSAFTSALTERTGMYMFPTGGLTEQSTRKDHAAAMEKTMEEMKTKPSGLLVYHPPGRVFNFPKALAVEFATNFLEALIVVFLLTRTALASFGARWMFVAGAGLLAAVATNVSYWNWFGFSKTYTLAQMTMEFVGYVCAGLAIALVLKNTPSRAG